MLGPWLSGSAHTLSHVRPSSSKRVRPSRRSIEEFSSRTRPMPSTMTSGSSQRSPKTLAIAVQSIGPRPSGSSLPRSSTIGGHAGLGYRCGARLFESVRSFPPRSTPPLGEGGPPPSHLLEHHTNLISPNDRSLAAVGQSELPQRPLPREADAAEPPAHRAGALRAPESLLQAHEQLFDAGEISQG